MAIGSFDEPTSVLGTYVKAFIKSTFWIMCRYALFKKPTTLKGWHGGPVCIDRKVVAIPVKIL